MHVSAQQVPPLDLLPKIGSHPSPTLPFDSDLTHMGPGSRYDGVIEESNSLLQAFVLERIQIFSNPLVNNFVETREISLLPVPFHLGLIVPNVDVLTSTVI